MNPIVSVNLCCYNSEKYLEETLQSIFTQTFKEWELVIINDGSSDATEEIIQRHIAEGWPIVYDAQPNAGLPRARNKALSLSRGKYIALIDHDDLFLADTLEKQVRSIEKEQAALSYGGFIIINTKGEQKRRIVPRHKSGFLLGSLLRRYEIGLSGVVLSRDAMRQLNVEFDPMLTGVEDYGLFMLLAANRRVAVVPDVLAKIRFHADSLTNRLADRWAAEHDHALRVICKRHPEVERTHAKELRQAYARSSYFRACWLVNDGRRGEALRELAGIALVDSKYLIFFLILLTSTTLWHQFHARLSSNRSVG